MIDHLPDRLDLYATAEAGRVLQGRIKLASLDRVLSLLATREGELQVLLELGRDQDGTRYLTGSIKGMLVLQCQRCLEPMEYPLDVRPRLGLVQSQDEAERLTEFYEPLILTREPALLAEVISDEVLLALPIVPLHEDMSKCQALATAFPAPASTPANNPFAVLEQLKQKQ
jgi:uncharacterized protein